MQWITLMLLTVCLATCSQSEDAVGPEEGPPLYHYDDSDIEYEDIDRLSIKTSISKDVSTLQPGNKSCVVPSVSNGKIGSLDSVDGQTHFKELKEGTRLKDGSYLFLRCDEKYELFGNANREEKITCDRGEWDRKPHCKPASCRKPPPQVTNAHQLTFNTSHGAKMLYYCIKDFRKSQFEDIKCNFGDWTGTPPACKDTRCDTNSIAYPGVKKETGKRYYKYHESYSPICEEGYSAVMPNRLICINEEWNGQLPPCKLAAEHNREGDSVMTTVRTQLDLNKVVLWPTPKPVTTTSQQTTTEQTWVPLSPDVKDGCSIENIKHGKLIARVTKRYCNIFGLNCRNWNESFEVEKNRTFTMGSSLNLTCDPGYTIRGRAENQVVIRCFRGQWIPSPVCMRNRWNVRENETTPRPQISTPPPITEQPSGHRSSGNELSAFACENAELNVKCAAGKVIHFIRANYGRRSSSKCNGDISRSRNVKCLSDKSGEIMREICDKKPSCNVEASNSVFGDPCLGTVKYLEIQYQCVPDGWSFRENELTARPMITTPAPETEKPSDHQASGNVISAHACENSRLIVECERGKVIQFLGANYGRTTSSKCNTVISKSRNVRCLSEKSGRIMQEKCDQKSSCNVEASNSVFGDPCVGTIKYLEMQFQCVPRSEISIHACENTRLNVECEAGKVIRFLRANYGRTTSSKCNTDISKSRNVGCVSEKSREIMRERCNQKRSCSIEASNSVFGDPCYGTIKYLEMQYQCIQNGWRFLENETTTRPLIATIEKPSDHLTSGNEHSIYACENTKVSVECEAGKVIRFLRANYGRTTSSKCNTDASLTRNVRCLSDKSGEIMREKCDQRRSCVVEASNSVFGDPCRGTIKYLEMQYRCVLGNEFSTFACENTRLNVECGRGQVIRFLRANYGRTTSSKCNADISLTRNVRCLSNKSGEIMKEKCDQKRSCVVEATNAMFGDPCHGTIKYLEMEYQCIPDKSPLLGTVASVRPKITSNQAPTTEQPSDHRLSENEFSAFACENTRLNVECEAGKVIRLIRANYGRRTSSKCNADISRSMNVRCLSDKARDIMREKCDQKRSCIVEASNSVFGDPCYGTIKYLEMQYRCVPEQEPLTSYACENLNLNVDCGRDKEIYFFDANYGRTTFSRCITNDSTMWNTRCVSNKSREIMREICDQKQSCVVQASNSVFGDPCPGTIKYLEMQYLCVPARHLESENSHVGTWNKMVTASAERPRSKSERMSEAEDRHQGVSGCHPIQKPTDSQLLLNPEFEFYRIGQLVTFTCPPGLILSSETMQIMCIGGESEWSTKEIPHCNTT